AAKQDAKNKVELNCHASAISQVSAMQNKVIDQMGSNSYDRGTFNQLLQNVGLSDRQHWQLIAEKYYNWCMESTPTSKSIDAINQGFTVNMNQAKLTENSL